MQAASNPPLPTPADAPHPIAAWAAVGTAAFGSIALLDLLVAGQDRGASTVFWLASVSLVVGAMHGLCWGAALMLLGRMRPRVGQVFWVAMGLLGAAWLSIELGVFVRLGGPYHNLALSALAGSAVLGAGLGLGALGMQPSARRPRGYLPGLRLRYRALIAAVLVVGAVATAWLDRTIEVGDYAAAHLALQVAGVWALLFAVMLFQERLGPRLTRTAKIGGVALTVCFIATVATLGPRHERQLSAMLGQPYPSLALRSLRVLGDPDGDGYSAYLGGSDCDSFDAAVNPGAEEIPGNGVDDNCRLGDPWSDARRIGEIEWPDAPSSRSVILITVDTVAAVHTSLYGNGRDTTPQLVKWSKGAAVFDRAYTSGGWTSLALSSLFRGLYPRRLQWTKLVETTEMRLLRVPAAPKMQPGEKHKNLYALPLDDPQLSLATAMKKRGLTTVAVVNDGHTEFLGKEFMGAGYDRYVDLDKYREKKAGKVYDGHVTTEAIKALRKLPKGKPFFMWVHYFGPHLGNSRHAGIKSFGRSQAGRYEHEIRYMDREVARLLKVVRARGRKQDIAVVFTSDHGEVVSRKGRGHGRDLRERATRIPLVVQARNYKPGRYRPVASLVDVFPTVLGLTQTPIPDGLDGIDLRRIVEGDAEVAKRQLITETWRLDKQGARRTDKVAAFDGQLKLTWDLRTEARALRRQTRIEKRSENLLGQPGHDAAPLQATLERYLEECGGLRLVD